MRRLWRSALLFISLALFAACATPEHTAPSSAGPFPELPGMEPLMPAAAEKALPPDAQAQTDDLEQMARDGRFLDAALGYTKLAAAAAPQRAQYTLRAAELLLTGNYIAQAETLLQDLGTAPLAADLQLRLAVIRARIAQARGNPQVALASLGKDAFFLARGDADLLITLHRLRAEAFDQLGNHLEAARERVEIDALLSERSTLEDNQRAILQTLKRLTPDALSAMRASGAPDIFSGWIALAIIDQGGSDARQGGELLDLWRARFPRHPAFDSILEGILAGRAPAVAATPQRLALILPLKARFAKAAEAIRDGFLAAHYAQLHGLGPQPAPGSFSPEILIYDEGENPAHIDTLISQAVHDGADFIVGPLDKEAVNRLARYNPLPVPVLALNFSETAPAQTSPADAGAFGFPPIAAAPLYQLSLSPEEEARQAAERAWLDGHARAALVIADSAWGERVGQAFRSRWQEIGGEIIETATYDITKSDYSLPIQQLLSVDQSEQRKAALVRLLGQKLEFVPRRRQDVDFIFMAASAPQARLLRPQLRFHHAGDVPVYATSHVYTGSVNADLDRDMDDVMFADVPWTLGGTRPDQALKTEIERLWPAEAMLYARLYALGVDAYRIIARLEALSRDRAAFFAGETGDLYLDKDNRLQRRLPWARFQNGVPRLLDGL